MSLDNSQISNNTNALEFSVSEISQNIKRTIEDNFGYVRVRGEIGRVSRPASGHVYLDLKDEKSSLSAVIWKGVIGTLSHQPEQGLEVIATGKITTFQGQSKYQLVIENLAPAGVGALMAMLEERKKKFIAEGLFDEVHKKEIPFMPKSIGVITSPSGAVIRDIIHRIEERFPVNILLWPVRVQGESSENEVIDAINGFNNIKADRADIKKPDLLIIARGGGSIEDLWSFNGENLVRVAFKSQIPIISAIGHETDWTLLDYVADLRAPTPTAAAEFATPVKTEINLKLSSLYLQLQRAHLRQLDNRKLSLSHLSEKLLRFIEYPNFLRQKLDHLTLRFKPALLIGFNKLKSQYEQIKRAFNHQRRQNNITYKLDALNHQFSKLQNQISRNIAYKKNELEKLFLKTPPPLNIIGQKKENLRWQSKELIRNHRQIIKNKFEKLYSLSNLLNSVSHHNTLKRGYVIVRSDDKNMVRSVKNIENMQRLNLEFFDGNIDAIAAKIGNESPKKTIPIKDKPIKTNVNKIKKNDVPSGQGKLFE